MTRSWPLLLVLVAGTVASRPARASCLDTTAARVQSTCTSTCQLALGRTWDQQDSLVFTARQPGLPAVAARELRVLDGTIGGQKGVLVGADVTLAEGTWTLHPASAPDTVITHVSVVPPSAPVTLLRIESMTELGTGECNDSPAAALVPTPGPRSWPLALLVIANPDGLPTGTVFDVWVAPAAGPEPREDDPPTLERASAPGLGANTISTLGVDGMPMVSGNERFHVALRGVLPDGRKTSLARGTFTVPFSMTPGCPSCAAAGPDSMLAALVVAGLVRWGSGLVRRRTVRGRA